MMENLVCILYKSIRHWKIWYNIRTISCLVYYTENLLISGKFKNNTK